MNLSPTDYWSQNDYKNIWDIHTRNANMLFGGREVANDLRKKLLASRPSWGKRIMQNTNLTRTHLLVFLILLIMFIYIRYNLKVNPNFELLQVMSNNLTHDVLYEKQPIVITDRISDAQKFIDITMTYDFITQSYTRWSPLNFVSQNLSSYMIIHNSGITESGNKKEKEWMLYIAHPKHQNNFKWVGSLDNRYLVSNYTVTDHNKINNTQFVGIKLRPGQMIILPAFWMFYLDTRENSNKNDTTLVTYNMFGMINYVIAYTYTFKTSIG
jgi:hypothetical protein